jgi:trimeric autotransporter adhesin
VLSVRRIVLAASIIPALLIAGCGDFFSSGDSIAAIAISPASRLAATSQTINFTANGQTVNGTSKDVTSTATWTSSDTSVATVSSAGVVQTVSTGTATISAKQDSVTGTATLTVTPSQLQSIAISPTTPTVLASQGTLQFTATGTFADGSTADLTTTVVWTSSNSGVATFNANGSVNLVAAGTSTITANITTGSGVVTNSTTLTVQ